ncbi:hypothetical protein [Allosalinactinospora lopnorensis]|uniref:hypothetical protein n=1 Tax=Allosalinactinospora lopnorensis TaxID=1352348 RepID=UPI000623CB39|nr:hypothetical protein [Allosalinactinospora lopnorensis]
MRTRHSRVLALLSAPIGLIMLAPPASADHEDMPTARQLLERCDNGTDKCVFHPSGAPEYYAEAAHQVGDSVYNCSEEEQKFIVAWEETKSQSNSVGVAMTTEAGFGKAFNISYEQSYEHTWESSHTEAQRTFVFTGPYEVGWVERAPRMERVKGQYELNFGDRYHGHYYWYVPFEITGPAPDGTEAVVQKSREMTAEEKAQCP